MKIVDVQVSVVDVSDGVEIVEGSRLGWVFVEVETDDGLVGLGECSNWPRRGNHVVARTLEVLRHRLIGRDPSQIEAIWIDLYRGASYLGNRGLITTVMSGLDIALWDIRGQMLGCPIWQLLGGSVRERVPLYTHPRGDSTADAVESTNQLLAEGFDAVKFDPFVEMHARLTSYLDGRISRRGLAAAVEMVSAVRGTGGDDLEILIDCHGHFDVPTAISAIRALEPFGVTWFEEPVPPDSLSALAQVRAATSAALCVGERAYTRWDVAPILASGLVSYLMPDVCWTGGISELKKIATMAEAHYVPISPHNALGPVQIVAGGHVAKTVPNLYRLEINSLWLDRYNAVLESPIVIEHGELMVPDAAGLGIRLDRDVIARRADQSWRLG